MGLGFDSDEDVPEPEEESIPRDVEDTLLEDTPSKTGKRKGTPDKPSTPAKRKEGHDAGPRARADSLRDYFAKEPPPQKGAPGSPGAANNSPGAGKGKNKSKHNNSKQIKQRHLRKK